MTKMRGTTRAVLGLAALCAATLVGLQGCANTAEAPIVSKETSPGSPAPVRSRSSTTVVLPRTSDGTTPAQHEVQRGETLYAIAFRYGLEYQKLAQWNGIASPYTIYPGQTLRLQPPPGGEAAIAAAPAGAESKTQRSTPQLRLERVTPAPAGTKPSSAQEPSTATPSRSASAQSAALGETSGRPAAAPGTADTTVATAAPPTTASPSRDIKPAADAADIAWQWPARGRVLTSDSPLGKKGIEIAGTPGQPVLAAAAGEVVYSGSGLIGYGKLIIVKHNDVFLSAYGNNSKLLVGEGTKVVAGQQIAEMGSSVGRDVSLHFEIRRNGKPVDPLQYLPKLQ